MQKFPPQATGNWNIFSDERASASEALVFTALKSMDALTGNKDDITHKSVLKMIIHQMNCE